MNKQEIRNHILKTLWDSWDKNKQIGLYLGIFSQEMFDEFGDTIGEVTQELESEGLYRGDYEELTGKGLIYAENQHLVDPERVLYHQNFRHKILSFLFQLYENKGFWEGTHIIELAEKMNADINQIDEEYRVLYELDFVKNDHLSISREGIEYWKRHLRLESFKAEFLNLVNLEGITPQQRGRKLEKLIAEVLEFAGWNQKANVTTSYEQIDVVIYHNREFYLIECKWEKDPIEADEIDKLFGKLRRRTGTNGFLMSMSGFTRGAIENVEDSTNQKLILLFGKKDIEKIISNPDSFDSLFNEKVEELVIRRKAKLK